MFKTYLPGGGSVGGAEDISLDAGSKLIFDGDSDSNDYLIGGGSTISLIVSAATVFTAYGTGLAMNDSKRLWLGTGLDYSHIYNSSGTAYEFATTDKDGGGTDGVIFSVQDGTDDVVFNGDIAVVGNQTYYGDMYISSQQTVTISIAATPVQVGTFTTGDLNGVTFAANELTVTNAGTYKIDSSVSAAKASGAASRICKMYIYKDSGGGDAVISKLQAWRSLSATNDVGNASISGIVVLAAGDKLSLYIENTGGTENINIEAANISVVKV